MLHALGRLIARQARWFLVAWLVAVVAGFGAASGAFGNEALFDRLQAGDAPQVPGESTTGRGLLAASDTTGTVLQLLVDDTDPQDPALRGLVTGARPGLAGIDHVQSVVDPYLGPAGTPTPLVSTDGRAFLVVVTLEPDLTRSVQRTTLDIVTQRLDALGAQVTAAAPGARTTVGGVQTLVDEINGKVGSDLRKGETIALPLSLLVMVLVFGGLLAAGLPIVGAIASIGGGLATLLGFSYVIDLDSSVPSVVSVLGLGLCIDYGLLLVSRYREELRRLHARDGLGPDESPGAAALEGALEHTLGTAGRTILFSGITVAVSLAGLLVMNASILRAVGAAGVSVVVVALLVALTLVPALVAVSGDRLIRPGVVHRVPLLDRLARRLGDVAPAEGAFSRLARRVQRRPLVVIVAVAAVLVVAAVPVLSMRLVSSGVKMLPPDSAQRVLFETVETRFGALSDAAVVVVAPGRPAADLDAWAAQRGVADLPGVASVDPARVQGTGADAVAVLGIRTTDDAQSDAARAVVERVRDVRPGFRSYVTGEAANVADFTAGILARAPYAVGVVALATFVLLFLMTGSVLVPLKALVMNVVSLGASFGVLVWVFQEGHLESLLGFSSAGGIDTTIPALALAFAFGLSMDYEVFLLSRIKEFRDLGLDNDAAVLNGLQRSGRIITSAALIIVVVFAGFVAGDLLIIKQIGVALAVAVAVDATLVRMLLVPATMTLLGEWNWWAPEPLRRLHDRFGLREGPEDLEVDAYGLADSPAGRTGAGRHVAAPDAPA